MKKIVLTIIMVSMLIVSVFALTGCGEKKEEEKGLIGKWGHSSFVYTFNNDKSGEYDVAGRIMKFTYEDDGEQLSILYEGNTSPTVLKYRIDGNKLIITDSFGSDVEYTKK